MLDSFLLRSLAVSGYAPSFDECARCGAPGPHVGLPPGGGRDALRGLPYAGVARPAVETVRLLGALLAGEWDVVNATDERYRREASTLVAAFVSWHLERGLKSLPHLSATAPGSLTVARA